MYIKGSQLLYMLQVIKDSLKLQLGTDWAFEASQKSREKFYNELIKSLIDQEDKIEVRELDLGKMKSIL